MTLTARGTLQTATTIAKTTQTLIGAELDVSGHDFITLFFDYVNGDETGIFVQAHFLQASGGTEYQESVWTNTTGTSVAVSNQYTATASISRSVVFDVRGKEFIKFTQGGSDNDGTPTGTLAATYTMTG